MLDGEVGVIVVGSGPGAPTAVLHGGELRTATGEDLLRHVAAVEAAHHPRWVWWSAESGARGVVAGRVHLARAWDVAEAHRLLRGGWDASPALAWAAAHGLSASSVPAPPTDDLFDLVGAADLPPADVLLDAAGHLRADHERWLEDPAHLRPWAEAALTVARRQLEQAAGISPRLAMTVASESAAALLCLELERDGLPLDRARTEELVAGPRAHAPSATPRPSPPGGPGTPPCSGTSRGASPSTCATRPRSRSCSRRWASTSRPRASGCSRPTARCTPSSTPSSRGAATNGSRRPTATAGSTATSGRTTGCAGGGPPATARPAG